MMVSITIPSHHGFFLLFWVLWSLTVFIFLFLVKWVAAEIVNRDGKSSLFSLVKAFDSVLAVYEGFCNLKQVVFLSISLKLFLSRVLGVLNFVGGFVTIVDSDQNGYRNLLNIAYFYVMWDTFKVVTQVTNEVLA